MKINRNVMNIYMIFIILVINTITLLAEDSSVAFRAFQIFSVTVRFYKMLHDPLRLFNVVQNEATSSSNKRIIENNEAR